MVFPSSLVAHKSFGIGPHNLQHLKASKSSIRHQTPRSPKMLDQAIDDIVNDYDVNVKKLLTLKNELIRACGLCDRGFVATNVERERITTLIEELSILSPTTEPTLGVDGDVEENVPLRGCWRMAYTSALDVLSLAASPIASVGAIYQDARNLPAIVNVIDQNPRLISLLPASAKVQSTLRLKVLTRAKRRSNVRVGLDFESVTIEPKSLLGQVDDLPSLCPSTSGQNDSNHRTSGGGRKDRVVQ